MWLERQALHDPLTKLPNRLLLMDRTRQALARLHRSKRPGRAAVHRPRPLQGGQRQPRARRRRHLLISVSERLAEMLRDSDTVARLGGDEFVILAEEIDSDAKPSRGRARAARPGGAVPGGLGRGLDARQRGRLRLARPDADPEDMLREADVAMYRAKGAGGSTTWSCSTRSCAARSARTWRSRGACATRCPARAAARLPAARAARRRTAVGCEALVRWHPHGRVCEDRQLLPSTPSCRWPRRAS
jgi:GGDEF domain-containing protein